MKKHLLFFWAAAAMLGPLSCSKNTEPAVPQPAPGCHLTLHIGPDTATKSEYEARKDYQVSSVQVFVFDKDKKMETDYYAAITPTSQPVPVDITTFTGEKTIYALLNHDRLVLAKDYALDTFENLMSDLSENSPTNLVMVGKKCIQVHEYDKNKNPSAVPESVSIFAKRLAAMVVVDKVTVNFSKTSLAGATFILEEIYLKNVVGKCHLGLSAETGSKDGEAVPLPLSDTEHTTYSYWYNKGTKQASGAPSVTVDSWTHTCSNVSGGDGNALGRCLFAYPNKTVGDSHLATFDQRKTRLVIKAHVTKENVTPAGGVDSFYVFDLPVLAANRVYRVSNVIITMLGKDDDNSDDNLQAGKLNPTITVDGWTETSPLSYEL